MTNKKDLQHILIRGAKENNLKNVSLDIPKNRIVVFTGISGSGKSSIVFDTIAVESQRQLNETFSWYIRNRLPKYERPKVERIENLSTAIIVNQKQLGGNSRSTVGTIADIQPLVRLLFSRSGSPGAGSSNCYSFNDPAGMCPHCQGLGRVAALDLDKMLNKNMSLNGGAVLFPPFRTGTWHWQKYANSGFFDNDKPLKEYTDREMEMLLYGNGAAEEGVRKTNDVPVLKRMGYEGIVNRFNRIYLNRDSNEVSERTSQMVSRFVHYQKCPECEGKRLSQAALNSRIHGFNIADYSDMEINDLIPILRKIDDPLGQPVAEAIIGNLERIINVGLGYLSLSRETATLSGGESQRLKMVKHLGSSLSSMVYIFDEPSIGLHPRDIGNINQIFRALRDKGNTVLIVEHDKDVISIADRVIDVGPAAGLKGGEVVFEGTVEELSESDTVTGKMFRNIIPLNTRPRQPMEWYEIKNAVLHNLKNVTVKIPKGVLTCVTGVAGSGKSTLITEIFTSRYPEAIVMDQSAVGVSIRSNPATYLGIMDDIRSLLAKANGVKPGFFSFNSDGACPTCKGRGLISSDMAFMDPVITVCETCSGHRFRPEVLQYKYKGKSITDILSFTIRQAMDFFAMEKFISKIASLYDVGLGYLTLGQSLDTLSGGELQRIKLADELKKTGSLYVMDEPTTGLHMADTVKLMTLLNRLVDNGNTVVIIEHNLDVVKQADWIIDMGPDGGKKGGEVIFEGNPQALAECGNSFTAEYLRKDIAKNVK